MIKIEELRVGNCVAIHPEMMAFDEHIKVKSVHIDIEEGIFPISLTEAWMIEMGFRHETDGVYTGWDGYVHIEKDWIIIEDNLAYESGSDYIPLKYVHQLQNLFYALTYTDLVIKDIQ